MVVASGNSSEDTDVIETHFTAKDGSNVLCVAATDENDNLTSYSNYGATRVDLAAPGGTPETPIMSTFAFTDISKYIGYPGTSMATPIVAGAAAVVKSVNPGLTAEQIKAILVHSGRSVSSLEGKVSSGKILDVAAAVQEAKATAPAIVTGQN
jgi:subtilisin family serine protease